jgi:hypothetical protein
MTLSLRNLFGGRRGGRAPRTRARPPGTTRLNVEALEERAVPAVMNLKGYTFFLPGATLHVTSENVANGVFAGTFFDAN